ncbi:MAG: hypothetical protein AB8G05_07740 [Oligoflexales bacterium]
MNGIQIFRNIILSSTRSNQVTTMILTLLACYPIKAAEISSNSPISNLRKSILEQIEDSDESTINPEYDSISESDEMENIFEKVESTLWDNYKLSKTQEYKSSKEYFPRHIRMQKSSGLKHPPHRLKGLSYDLEGISDQRENDLQPHAFLKNNRNGLQLGLENFGNTCFFNGVIKLLASDQDFSLAINRKIHLDNEAELTEDSYSLNVKKSLRIKKSTRLKNHFLTLINMIRQSSDVKDKQRHYKQISKLIKKVFRDYRELYYLSNNKSPESLPGAQQDPEEFLQNLLSFIGYQDHSGFTLADSIKWDHEESVRISSKTHNSILSLSIKPFGFPCFKTLQEAIDHFFNLERVNGSASNNFVGGSKQFKLLNAPKTLLIQLKRYELDYITMQTKRVSSLVKVEPINIKIFDENSGEEYIATYKPIAVQVHDTLGGDSLNFGHYYTYVKEGAHWIEHDDYRPPYINHNADATISKNAYLLKYNLEFVSMKH